MNESDLRSPLLIEHSVRELVAQRLLGLAAGYEDLNDHNLLRLDPFFAVVVGKEDPLETGRAPQDQGKALASASTLNRMELGNNKNTRCHKISANHEAIEDTLCTRGCAVCPNTAKRLSSIWMPVTIRSTATRKDVSFTASMAATAICRSLPLSALSRSGPSCAPATGTRLEERSRRSRKSFLRSVNVAPKPRSLSVPLNPEWVTDGIYRVLNDLILREQRHGQLAWCSLELVHKILRASAAIPGAFPSVMINVQANGRSFTEMHVDGSVVAQVFVYWAGVRLNDLAAQNGGQRQRKVYILRNARLDPEWSSVKRQTLSITFKAIAGPCWSARKQLQ